MTQPDNTRSSGATPDTDQLAAQPAVSGGPADRLDSPGEGTGGVPAAGADGQTSAREDLRQSLGERTETAGREDGDSLEQVAAIGETDDPQGGSIQQG